MDVNFQPNRTYMCYSGWTNGRVNMYTIYRCTDHFIHISSKKKHKVKRDKNGVEFAMMGTYANADRITADVYIGAGTPVAKEYEQIHLKNCTTDRLLDY